MNAWVKSGVAVALIGCVSTVVGAQAVWSRLNTTDRGASDKFVSALESGSGPGNAAKPFLAMPSVARAAVVTEVVAWAKTYYKSAAFKKAWAERREANKPDAPAASAAAVVAKDKADTDKRMADVKKMLDSLPPEQRKAVEESMKQVEAQTKDPAFQAQQAEMAENRHGDDQKKYQEDLKQWEQDYPVDPAPVIARRLRAFLAATADVDFDAKLVSGDGGRMFANPDYEAKSSQWKMGYRAGREATTAARTAASAWLKELGQ